MLVAACSSAQPVAPASPTRWPPIVDSHVHLAYWPVADRLAKHGVLAAVDLAAPESTRGGASSITVLAGVTVLYGTDLGNLRDDGPSADEVALLRKAGLDDAAITAAMTTTPIAYWELDVRDSYLVLDSDPRRDATALLHPREVWRRGRHL